MRNNRAHVPWHYPSLWREANRTTAYLIRKNADALTACRCRAVQLRAKIASTFPLMDWLCRETCPDCVDNCCQRAWVWIDFKDLLYLHLADVPVPAQQMLRRQGDHCRYHVSDGCRLDRSQRPFVCTWYLCPPQKRILDAWPIEKRQLSDMLDGVKALRRQVEDLFVQATR